MPCWIFSADGNLIHATRATLYNPIDKAQGSSDEMTVVDSAGQIFWVVPFSISQQESGKIIGGPVKSTSQSMDQPDPEQQEIQTHRTMISMIVNSLTRADHQPQKHNADLSLEFYHSKSIQNPLGVFCEAGNNYSLRYEMQLLEAVENKEKKRALQLLDMVLSSLFLDASDWLYTQNRIVDLVVLLSRSAIRSGSKLDDIFKLNLVCLNKLQAFRNRDEITLWLRDMIKRFVDQPIQANEFKHSAIIQKAITYIRINKQEKVSLDDVASHVFLSPSHFCRVFKTETGENFNDCVNRIRIEEAKRLLLTDQVAMKDLADILGFDGQSYFSKVFKKSTGITPSKYRESIGKIRHLIAG